MAAFRLFRPEGPVWDWLLPWLLTERLGIRATHVRSEAAEIRLESEGKALVFPGLAAALMGQWSARKGSGPFVGSQRLSRDACAIWPLTENLLPVLAPEAQGQTPEPPHVAISEGLVRFSFDPLALPALLLSGAEEILDPTRDTHDRYPASCSLAGREGWLDRPVVDETVALLRALLNHLWPGSALPAPTGRMQVSCDVDQPFSPDLRQPATWLRAMGGDLISRRDPVLALRRAAGGVLVPLGLSRLDISNTFGRYLSVLERHGLRGQFFIISGHSAGAIDGSYHLHQPRVRGLLAGIAARGHSLGMHGSYHTFRDPAQIATERGNLLKTVQALGLTGDHGQGNRQHYLRWDMACTPDHLVAAGFAFDTSGSYPDAAGFRYGTSHAFPMWSWPQGRALALRQQPLIAMECSVIAPRYMGLGYGPAAYATFERLQDRALEHGGTFTLLWHNSHFMRAEDWALFEHLVARGST